MTRDPGHSDSPLRIMKERKEEAFSVHNADLLGRLREKGVIE
jgi:hypothetical protein